MVAWDLVEWNEIRKFGGNGSGIIDDDDVL